MKIEEKDVFAVEIDGSIYHLGCKPSNTEITEEDLIMQGDEETGDLYFCDECGKQII